MVTAEVMLWFNQGWVQVRDGKYKYKYSVAGKFDGKYKYKYHKNFDGKYKYKYKYGSKTDGKYNPSPSTAKNTDGKYSPSTSTVQVQVQERISGCILSSTDQICDLFMTNL